MDQQSNDIKSALRFHGCFRLTFKMNSLRQVTRQMLVYLSTFSLGIINFYRNSDKNVLHILSVANVSYLPVRITV